MIDVKEILHKHGAYWVSKLDNKKSIDCENAKEAIKEIITETLKEAAENAEVETHYPNPFTSESYERVNKNSITSVINKVKF